MSTTFPIPDHVDSGGLLVTVEAQCRVCGRRKKDEVQVPARHDGIYEHRFLMTHVGGWLRHRDTGEHGMVCFECLCADRLGDYERFNKGERP